MPDTPEVAASEDGRQEAGRLEAGRLADAQPDDDSLAIAARHDPAQYAQLYRRYVGRVYRYFYGRTGSPADAEDLTAQLFLDVLQALPRYRPQGTFAAWLFTLARRRAADYHRSRPAALPLEWAEALTGDSDVLAGSSAALAGGSDVLGEVIRAERLRRLAELFNRLDEDRQDLIRLRYGAGLTHRQVGKILGKSEAAVAMALHRTLHWFQENWEAQDE